MEAHLPQMTPLQTSRKEGFDEKSAGDITSNALGTALEKCSLES
jgi:hypothetical protein